MTIQIAIRLPDQLVSELDALVSRGEGPTNRTAAIQRALEDYLALERRRAIDRSIVEGYTRLPPPTVDEWGDLDAEQLAWASMTSAALDTEDGGWT